MISPHASSRPPVLAPAALRRWNLSGRSVASAAGITPTGAAGPAASRCGCSSALSRSSGNRQASEALCLRSHRVTCRRPAQPLSEQHHFVGDLTPIPPSACPPEAHRPARATSWWRQPVPAERSHARSASDLRSGRRLIPGTANPPPLHPPILWGATEGDGGPFAGSAGMVLALVFLSAVTCHESTLEAIATAENAHRA